MLLRSGPAAIETSTHSSSEASGALYIISVMTMFVTLASIDEERCSSGSVVLLDEPVSVPLDVGVVPSDEVG